MTIANLVWKDMQCITPHFSSYADRVCIEISGTSTNYLPYAELYCDTADDESRLYDTYQATISDEQYRCTFFFDPINLQIYQNAVSFWIVFHNFATVSSFSMEEHTDSCQADTPAASAVFTDDAGNKWVPVLQSDRTTQLIVPALPHNALFVGNSILLGMPTAYGMCSSSPKHDYCYHVQQAIRVASPHCCFSKLYASPFEHSTTLEEFEDWWSKDPNGHTGKPAVESFTPDLDLIILQIGDNVGPQKLANFLRCTPILLQRIKTRCPKARILWVHGWFNSPLTTPPITRFCEEWQLERVDVLSTRSPESQSFRGASYETADGTTATVQDIWVTHPGDLGMRLIAERIIEVLAL